MVTDDIIKKLGFTPEPDQIDPRIIRQGSYWVDKQGNALEIAAMGAKHVGAVINMLGRAAPSLERALIDHECVTGVGAGSDHGEEQFQRHLAMSTGERMAQSPLMRALLKRQKELATIPTAEPTAPFTDLAALAAHRVVCGATSWDEDHKYGGTSLCWEVSRAVAASIAENAG